MKFRFCIAIIILCNALVLASAPETVPEATLKHKTEVKYLIPDLGKLPAHIMDALRTGDQIPDISSRGLVIQEYLPLTKKNILNVSRALKENGIPFGKNDEVEQFLFPGKAQELRLIRKYLKTSEGASEVYQVSLEGTGGISSSRIITPEKLTFQQQGQLRKLFLNFKPLVNNVIRKIYFEINATTEHGNPVRSDNQMPCIVDIDIFIKRCNGQVLTDFIDGEICFRDNDQDKAITRAKGFRHNTARLIHFLGKDITGFQRMKSRNIAWAGVPAYIFHEMEIHAKSNAHFLNQILSEFETWIPYRFLNDAIKPLTYPLGEQHRLKLLMNAEPFGFGPSSAVAEIFPYLRAHVSHLAYIGVAHTLNLQRGLPYDRVYDYDASENCISDAITRETARKSKFLAIAKDYDVFFTACDFETAQWARELGLKVIIYDPLCWYWPEIPPVIKKSDLYLAQNFIGVHSRIHNHSDCFPANRVIVPPIVSGLYEPQDTPEREKLLVNLGGLSNPYMEQEYLYAYVRILLKAINETIGEEHDEVCYVSSKNIAENVDLPVDIQTLQPQQVQKLFASSSLGILTSGLGNIYEAGVMGKPVIWLPPVNDSQGQQITLLKNHGMVDFSIDWHDILTDEPPINYFAPQKEVLAEIARRINRMEKEADIGSRLKKIFRTAFNESRKRKQGAAISRLIEQVSYGGAKNTAEVILQWLQDNHQKTTCNQMKSL